MTTTKAGGKRPGSGRKKGSLNKNTVEIKTIAQSYGEEAVKRLVEIMKDAETPPATVVAACKELLDRGYGKAPLAIEDKPRAIVTHATQPVSETDKDHLAEIGARYLKRTPDHSSTQTNDEPH